MLGKSFSNKNTEARSSKPAVRGKAAGSIGADQDKLGATVKLEMESQTISTVYDSEAVLSSTYVHVWPYHAIDQHHVAVEYTNPLRRIGQATVRIEGSIHEHQWHIELS